MNKVGYYQNKSGFKQRRKDLRNFSTKAEILLWQKIKNKQLGVKFRRQYNIGYWIVDFYCHELKLIIELDGGIHFESEEKMAHDKKRQAILEKQGYIVIRYTNYKILDDTDSVVNNIIMTIKSLMHQTTPPNLPL
ncbi:MAG: endonuclease domain-containing protein [Candidatus Magasanikiibacteriota bacterium]